jgi:hypothetical protein
MLALLIFQALTGDIYDSTPLTVNLDPGWTPETYAEWCLGEPEFQPLAVRTILRTDASPDLLILFEEGLTDSLDAGLLDQWTGDIVLEGLSVEVAEITYAEPWELREYLQERAAEGLEGAVLVGALPAPWSALDNAFLDDSEQFPSDYFYMDLDGLWEDLWIGYPSEGKPGADGMYDTWKGDLSPEIYVGRIKVDNLSGVGDPTELLNAYLQRNHEWRTVPPSGTPTALCYVDNDWAAWGPSYQNALEYLYDDVVLVNDVDSTNGTDYRFNRLPADYEWISPFVHSSPLLHQWSPGPNTQWFHIVPALPQARFYNLFACSNARFTTTNNMGAVYTFGTSTGLASVGSSKSGSMLGFGEFYYPMGQGSSIGEGYMAWWDYIAEGGLSPSELSWHLGMVLLGDPTLVPAMYLLGLEEGADPSTGVPGLEASANPCRGSVEFRVTGFAEGELRLYDTAGRLAASSLFSGGSCLLEVSRLEPGVYFARAVSGTVSVSTSVVVCR